MTTTALGTVLDHLRRSLLPPDEAGRTDGELLDCFIARRDESAFEVLVQRHGPMVLGVCRRVLRNESDAEDAFQATFLVLVRKAASIRPRGMVGNWLYGVAHSTALKARAMSSKRLAKEREAAVRPRPEVAERASDELQELLDSALKDLPDIYRSAIVLCDLEGKSIKEAARQLGCPPGTVGTRLARGRALLARRLTRRGVTLSAGIAALIAQNAAAASVSPLLMSSTVKAATILATNQAAVAGLLSARVAALTEGVLTTMFLTRLKVMAALVLTIAGIGAFAWAGGVAQEPATLPEKTATPPAREKPPPAIQNLPRATENRKTADSDSEPISAVWITNKRVQQELRLTEAQVKKLETIRLEVYRKHQAELKKAQEEAKKQNLGHYREVSRKIQAEETKALTEAAPRILSARAIQRLRQIQRQARGLHHMIREPAVQRKLNLNDEQVKQIEGFLKAGLEAARKEASKRATGPVFSPLLIEDFIVMEQKAYAPAMKGVVSVLTQDQRRVWDALLGEPFAFKPSPAK